MYLFLVVVCSALGVDPFMSSRYPSPSHPALQSSGSDGSGLPLHFGVFAALDTGSFFLHSTTTRFEPMQILPRVLGYFGLYQSTFYVNDIERAC